MYAYRFPYPQALVGTTIVLLYSDHGHHDSSAKAALHDMVAFDEAVQKAVDMTSDDDTMIIVTADHSHTMSFGGYADRGNPIFGEQNFRILKRALELRTIRFENDTGAKLSS